MLREIISPWLFQTLPTLAVCAGLFVLWLWRPGLRHRRNIKTANKVLLKIRSFDHPIQVFGYIRKVDPFVFEEMILTCFQEQKFKIRRNKRYTGDGGIDGIVYIEGLKYLVQAKRYSGYITKSHVVEFIDLCNSKGCRGLFVHTGKTGEQSKLLGRGGVIDIISGARLTGLLSGESFTLNKSFPIAA